MLVCPQPGILLERLRAQMLLRMPRLNCYISKCCILCINHIGSCDKKKGLCAVYKGRDQVYASLYVNSCLSQLKFAVCVRSKQGVDIVVLNIY